MTFRIAATFLVLVGVAFATLSLVSLRALAAPSDAGAVAASAGSSAPADQLHDPVADPIGAFDDVRAAKKIGWPLALLATLVMIARGLQTAALRWPAVKSLAWLGAGARAVVIAGIVTVSVAAYNTLALGGTWFAVAVASIGAALALLAPTPKPVPA